MTLATIETYPSPITHTHTHTRAYNTNKRSTHSGRFLAHLSTLSILEAMHAHQPLFAKTQKLSMLLTLHDNHHYKNEENNKYAHTCIAFGGDQVLAM
jgi:nitrate reductase assembly molybdenum cofactor insertion protein NarJ